MSMGLAACGQEYCELWYFYQRRARSWLVFCVFCCYFCKIATENWALENSCPTLKVHTILFHWTINVFWCFNHMLNAGSNCIILFKTYLICRVHSHKEITIDLTFSPSWYCKSHPSVSVFSQNLFPRPSAYHSPRLLLMTGHTGSGRIAIGRIIYIGRSKRTPLT